jgi:hypothetical protein
MSAIRWYTLERRIGFRSIVLKVLEIDLSMNWLRFSNNASFVKISNISPDSTRAKSAPFSQNKEELRRYGFGVLEYLIIIRGDF